MRENLVPILFLAVPGVLLTTTLVGGMTALGAGVAVGTAAVFGALIAATDPVAVVSLFRVLGVPRKLAMIVEGESLFNDGTAIVIFRIALAVVLIGNFDPLVGLYDFARGWLLTIMLCPLQLAHSITEAHLRQTTECVP